MAQDRDNLSDGAAGEADPRLEVEAKLLAYVEGDLDEEGRVEIEKHLAANPQHRRLMKELAEVRDMVRGLPRERAPVDMTEALTGQLERSVLFGESADDGEATLHINRWPQFLAVAAVVLLAVGLAAVIYFVLPPTGSHTGTVAMRTPAGGGVSDGVAGPDAAPAPARTELAEKPPGEAPALRRRETKEGETALAMNEARKDGGENKAAKGGQEALFETNLQVQRGRFSLGTVNVANNAATNAAGNTVYLVVCTDNPIATNTELTRYLTTNGIVWSQGAEPMPQGPLGGAAVQQQAVLGSRLSSVTVRMKDQEKNAQDAADARGQAKFEAAKSAQQETHQMGAAKPPAIATGRRDGGEASERNVNGIDQQPAGVIGQKDDRQNRLIDDANRARGGETPPGAMASPPATAPAQDVEREVARGPGQSYFGEKQAQQPAPSQQTVTPDQAQQPAPVAGTLALSADANAGGAIDGYIVARGLTRVQATALYDNLAKQPAAQKVEIVEDFDRAPDVPPAAPINAPGGGQALQQPLMQQQANTVPGEQYGYARQEGQAPATRPVEVGQRAYREYASKQAGGAESNWNAESSASAGVNSAAAPAAPAVTEPPSPPAVSPSTQRPAAQTEKKLDELEKSSIAQAAPALTLQATTRPEVSQALEPVPAPNAAEAGDRLDVVIVLKNQPSAAAQAPATPESASQPTAARAATPAGPATRPATAAGSIPVPAK